jgi:hypothetical protein
MELASFRVKRCSSGNPVGIPKYNFSIIQRYKTRLFAILSCPYPPTYPANTA